MDTGTDSLCITLCTAHYSALMDKQHSRSDGTAAQAKNGLRDRFAKGTFDPTIDGTDRAHLGRPRQHATQWLDGVLSTKYSINAGPAPGEILKSATCATVERINDVDYGPAGEPRGTHVQLIRVSD